VKGNPRHREGLQVDVFRVSTSRMLDRQGGGGQELGGAGVSPTWFGQPEAGSLCPLPWSMELREQAKTLSKPTNSLSKITRNSHVRIFRRRVLF
jgi:hypothetical protein